MLVLAAALASGGEALAADVCGGLPRLEVTTPTGFCVGVIAQKLNYPRGILPLQNGDLVVTEMGGWTPGHGVVSLFKRSGDTYAQTVLFKGLNRPHSVLLGPDGLVYVGEVGRIFRFALTNPAGTAIDIVGGKSATPGLPGRGLHSLTAMLFDSERNLIVNVGSATDHCEGAQGVEQVAGPCAEGEGANGAALLRKYVMRWPAGTVASWDVQARGLRNSVALALHPATGALWQADNGRDAIQAAIPTLKNDNELPHDELNLIERGAHYGWPYCYDSNVASPEYRTTACAASYRAPVRLLPAHSAPLGMTFYTGTAFPAQYQRSLIIGLHGYRAHGHRIVALMPDKAGAPLGKMVDLVSNWRTGPHSTGAPVDVRQGPDGFLYIADDRNGKLLRLQYAAP
ncbi:MAG TPA: PQQ-dependent sugar dehydrogenase [Telluria sp.]